MKYSKYIKLLSFIILIFLSKHVVAAVLRVEILTSQPQSFLANFSDGKNEMFSYHPVLILGSEYKHLMEYKTFSNINQIIFSFEDDMEEIKLDEVLQKRLLKWISDGWRKCITYSENEDRLVGETGKSYRQSGIKCPLEATTFEFTLYLLLGITDFTGLGFRSSSKPTEINNLKPGDSVVLRSNVTGCVIYTIIYIGNDIFLNYVRNAIYFQTIEQIKQLWDISGSSSIEFSNIDELIKINDIQPPESKSNTYMEGSGYMRPIDMVTPPSGTYIN